MQADNHIITVKNLRKTFTYHEKGVGLLASIQSLFKRTYKTTKAVDNIQFNIHKGEIVGFLGPNGAGKSTTLKILAGIMYPDSGNVNILNYIPWTDRKKYVQHIGVVLGQKTQLFWDLPPIDAFHLNKAIYRIDDKQFNERLQKLTTLLGVQDRMKRPTRQLSLGERMRCEFIIAMLHAPKIVFLDEPTIGLDIFAKETIRAFIKKINKEEGTTFIITSHDLEDIEHLCNRVIIINHGKIVFNDSVTKMKPVEKKYITVKFYEKVDKTKLQTLTGVKILDLPSPYNAKLQANTAHIKLEKLIHKLSLIAPIEDLDVVNPPIVEIIRKHYEK